ncbi:MAG TPA: FAD-dependent oxidoreductase, partial [Longimicrobiaceae bacterium]
GRIALGGFRDRGGQAEWTHDSAPCDAVQGMIEGFLRGTLGVAEPITHRWAASVGYTDDGLPVLAQVEPGVWAIGGYSGTGNVIGAICGRAAARLALTGESELAALFT